MPRGMATISADKIKSVANRAFTLSRSKASGSRSRQRGETAAAAVQDLFVFPRFQTVQYLLHPFETEKRAAQHQQWRNRPGMKALINKASGTRITLLTNDPSPPQTHGQLAIRPHAGNLLGIERQIVAQHPAVFSPPPLPITEISSSSVAISSSNVKRLLPAKMIFLLFSSMSPLEYALKNGRCSKCTISQYKFNNLTQINHSPASIVFTFTICPLSISAPS